MGWGFNADTNTDAAIERVLAPLIDTLERNKWLIVLIATGLTAGTLWLDAASGSELSLAALYLGPVALITWFIGRGAGRAWTIVVAGASILAEVLTAGAATDASIVAWNTAMVVMLSLVVVEVLARLHEALDVERDLARTDALTGVANTRSFNELATAELERARRYGRTFTLASLDLDHFKDVNDTLGHAVGDRLIHDVGQSIRKRLRRVDIVARVGGDEFVILLPETDAPAAAVALGHVHETLQSLTEDYGPQVRASIGSVTFVSPPQSVEEMLQLADVAMYQAKSAGGNRVESLTILRDTEAPSD